MSDQVTAVARPSEGRRLEALRRLDLVGTPPEEGLDELVRLLCDTLGADGAALTMVAQDTAWTKAVTTGPQVQVPRQSSLADRAVRSDEGRAWLTVNEDSSADGQEHPLLADLPRPATCASQVVRAPEGEPVGGIEVVWKGERDLDDRVWGWLERFAEHIGRMLELRAEVGEYRRFIELSPDPVTILDVDGAIEMANPAFADLLGHPAAEGLHAKTFLDLVDRRDRSRVTSELARVLFARRRTLQLDLHLIDAAGRSIPCSVSAAHLQGARRHLQLVVHDLSDRLREEEERSRLSEQLARAQRLDAVGQIAGGLAHDLNNLLMVMTSNLSLAEESLHDATTTGEPAALAATAEDLAELRLAVDRAVKLTRGLLQFGVREAGEAEVADVAACVDAVQGLVSRSLGEGVEFTVQIESELAPVAADPVQLERALVNLVMNARDALEDGTGTIRIEASRAPGTAYEPADRRTSTMGGLARDGVVLRVVDDGAGMDGATQASAFEPLFTTKGDQGGSGLGLAVVMAFADQVDGLVALDSQPGAGTTVSLLLPAADRPLDAVPVGLDVPVAGARVLLVDPGERTRRIITKMLRAVGYRVHGVGSGEEALAHLREAGTDLIVTEVTLPDTTGSRLLAEARSHDAGLPAIALASVDAPRTLDGVPILVKPFSHMRLLRTVERVMSVG